ncbi:MAG: ribose 5-phosphate isomerase B [Bacteroidales bacterium]|nr:ribose 5-phosphate isomerase B [Bacteroidales bacterium]
MKTVGLASDHAGYPLKEVLKKYLVKFGYETVDFGTHSTESMDYPDTAHPLAKAVENGEVDWGLAMCGTGNGMAISLNKHQKIRAGLAWSVDIGKLVKQHNNANVLVLPARFITEYQAKRIVKAFIETEFEGGRHQRRIDKIPC